MLSAEPDHRLMIGRIEPYALGNVRDSRIAGSTKELVELRAGAQSPGNRMFPAAGADK